MAWFLTWLRRGNLKDLRTRDSLPKTCQVVNYLVICEDNDGLYLYPLISLVLSRHDKTVSYLCTEPGI